MNGDIHNRGIESSIGGEWGRKGLSGVGVVREWHNLKEGEKQRKRNRGPWGTTGTKKGGLIEIMLPLR